jgi:hypothetical protein
MCQHETLPGEEEEHNRIGTLRTLNKEDSIRSRLEELHIYHIDSDHTLYVEMVAALESLPYKSPFLAYSINRRVLSLSFLSSY